ncbi:MAG: NgoFVII family restriction endonuclease [Campylobacterales bacterium]|nr:NgoFVII family restriction endonuclease [Campylobacterales bacterium]
MYEFPIEILENPLDVLFQCLSSTNNSIISDEPINQTIYLPLYGKEHIVYEKSGLNQWNAQGRIRDPNEVYIPIPAIIHKNYPSFFPNRDKPFNLQLPNGKTMQSKICQDGGKALMSYSNRELGQWILRDVLRLHEGELLTYEKLQILGVDSVRIDKINDFTYEINFASSGSYDRFMGLNIE